MSINVHVFDFDKTIYKYDSLIRFCFFIYFKYPIRFLVLPIQVLTSLLYFFKIISTKKYKEYFLLFLYNIPEYKVKLLSTEFWLNQYPENFNKSVLDRINIKNRNICISASPEIYLEFITSKLGLELIGTKLSYQNKRYVIIGENCKSEEKVKRLNQHLIHNDFLIESSYSDSLTDMPLFKISSNAYVVNKTSIKKLDFS